MRQKGRSRRLIHEPKLLILDRAVDRLDAAVARQVKDLLRERVPPARPSF